MANNSSDSIFPDHNETDFFHNLTVIEITVYSVPPLSLQVFLLIGGAIMNLSIVYISFRNKMIQGNFKIFILNLALLDLFVALCLVFYLLMSYAPDFIEVSDEAFLACAMYVFFAIIMGTLPLSLSRHVAITYPLRFDKMFSSRRSIVYCAIMDLLPVVTIIIIFRSPMGSFFYRVGWTIYLWSLPIGFIVILYCCLRVYVGIKRKLTSATALEERIRMKEAKEIAIVSIIQAAKGAPVCAPLIVYLVIATIYNNDNPDGTTNAFITTAWDICYTIFNTLLFAQPFFDALVTLSLMRQYRNAANKFLKKLHAVIKRKYPGGDRETPVELLTNGHGSRSDSRVIFRAITTVG